MEQPLHNRNIVVTRSWKQAAGFIAKLKELGAHPIPFPAIQIREPEDWAACDDSIARLASYDWVIFSSFNGAHYFLTRLRQRGIDAIHAKIAAVGRTTADAVRSFGHGVDLLPEEFSARGILQSLQEFDLKGKRFLLPTSNIGRQELQTGLSRRGALVDKLEAYRTVANPDLDAEGMRRRIRDGEIDCIAFFSPSAFNFFVDIMGRSIIDDIDANSIKLAAVGPVTAKAVRAANLTVDIQPAVSQEDDLVRELIDYYSRQQVEE
jgi:uroporphyrinogen-III synthase